MYDQYKRHINYLRISVTDRCNLRCVYCMPEGGVAQLTHQDILSFEEIVSIAKVAVNLGINKIRLTGGEPLVRKGIVSLVQMLAKIDGIEDLSMTTNGQNLHENAFELKEAGLNRVNISIDTLNEDNYKIITRGGDISNVLRGIDTALEAGLLPIKINCVLFTSTTQEEINDLKNYCRPKNLGLRFIQQMHLETGEFSIVDGGTGGNCSICNRLRLTANGMIKPCLFNEQEFSVRLMGAEKAIIAALYSKPLKGCKNTKGQFYNIGG